MKKIFLFICTILCTATIAISIYTMSKVQPYIADAPSNTSYIIKEYGGKIAVFTPEETQPLAVYDVYVHLLPENDIELLRKGVLIDNDYALQKALEDYGL